MTERVMCEVVTFDSGAGWLHKEQRQDDYQ